MLKKIIAVFILSGVLSLQAGPFLQIPGLFPHWKEFYKAREASQRHNYFDCRHAAILLNFLLGEKGEIIIYPVFGLEKTHAVVFIDGLYYDPINNKVSRALIKTIE